MKTKDDEQPKGMIEIKRKILVIKVTEKDKHITERNVYIYNRKN